MLALQERERYQSDGGIMAARLPALILLALVAAVGLAWALKLAFLSGWYLIFLVPAVGGGALAGVLYALVGWSHCRNRGLAAVLGITVGLTGYLGYYHLCFIDILPPGFAWRVDLLPRYIAFRMETDVQEDVGAPDADQAEDDNVDVFGNWLLFVLELGMVVGFTTSASWSRARRAYHPELGRWAKREKALLPPDADKPFRDALDGDRLAEFVATTTPGSDAQTCCSLLIEYATPSSGSPLEYPVYVSLEPPPRTRVWHLFRKGRGTQLRQVKLEIAETLTLRPLFAGLTQTLAEQHEELRGQTPTVAPTAIPEPSAGELAEITPVQEPYRQRVRTKGYAVWVNLVALTPAVYFFGGGALVAGGGYLAVEKSMPLGWLAVVAGVIGVVWGGYTGLYCLCVAENRWINRRLRREISQRPAPLIDGRDAEAICVSLIPRQNFAKVQLTMSSDLLLMKIDDAARRVWMEGDCDRYCIPGGAVALCEAECFYHAVDAQHQNQIWMVRLVVNAEEGQRELLLSVDETRWVPMTNAGRHRQAEAVCERINSLRG